MQSTNYQRITTTQNELIDISMGTLDANTKDLLEYNLRYKIFNFSSNSLLY